MLGGAIGAAAASPTVLLVGCAAGGGSAESLPEVTQVPLSEIPSGERLRILHRGVPVELLREGDRLGARSLLCTHFGCEVQWVDEEEVYRCPCHEGIFDAEGRVIAGPPSRPLRTLSVTLEGDQALVRDLPAT
jgi:Rieske Fe-S protein